MNVLGWPIRLLAQGLGAIGRMFIRLANLLWELVPALLPPDQLARQVQSRYDRMYAADRAPTEEELQDDNLESWELQALDRCRVNSGRLLAMGTGWGREALAIARRGVTVVGIEANPVAVRVAHRFARQTGIPAHFHCADFAALPYADRSFDFAILATTMYSAIPGTARRQVWLGRLGRLLKPGGLVLLSFEHELPGPSRTKALGRMLNAVLHKLPGGNRDYRTGDTYSAEHYMHVFQNEQEIRAELIGAGASIHELGWARGYAVVSFPGSAGGT